MTDRIVTKQLPGGAVLLEKELETPEDLLPDELRLENIVPEPKRRILCQACNHAGKRVDATELIVPTGDGFAAIPATGEVPPGEFMSFCAAHARRAKKKIRKRVRQMQRYAGGTIPKEK